MFYKLINRHKSNINSCKLVAYIVTENCFDYVPRILKTINGNFRAVFVNNQCFKCTIFQKPLKYRQFLVSRIILEQCTVTKLHGFHKNVEKLPFCAIFHNQNQHRNCSLCRILTKAESNFKKLKPSQHYLK